MNTKINHLPIGVFDSGVGGLTVLRALQQQLPCESFIYLGDTARLPYGTKGPETIARYTQQASQVLINRGIKLLVIACNTATALGLSHVQASFSTLPIIGVVEPGARAACAVTRNAHIAVIATEATVTAHSYQNAIKKIRPDARVVAQACSLFVALAEEGWSEGPITEAVAQRYLQPLLETDNGYGPDVLVLGCTHFPVLLPAIRNVVGDKINIIDSAQTTAETVAQMLQQLNIEAPVQEARPTYFLVTDAPERFARVTKRFLGVDLSLAHVELVDVMSTSFSSAESHLGSIGVSGLES